MTLHVRRSIFAAASLLAAISLAAQAPAATDTAKRKTAPDTDLPILPTRNAAFTTDEGTWMSLDVSPDGKTMVFDLIGDLYTLPTSGGKATRITSGMGFDGQPRFSPDGKSIVFVSDRSGYENLWLVDIDGKNPRALTKDKDAQYLSPAFTPDGKYLVVSRSKEGVLGSRYDLVMLAVDGGTGIKITGKGTGPVGAPAGNGPPPYNNYLGAAFGADARFIYAAVKRGGFKYNQMVEDAWQVGIYDRNTGRTYARTTDIGGGMRPALSKDGKWLAFGSRYDGKTGLKLRNLASGEEVWLAKVITRDDMESRYTRDVLPGYAFTPDSKSIVITIGGKFAKIDVPSGSQSAIPFSADVDVPMGPLVRFEYPINDSTIQVRQIRGATPSPDGKHLAFTALDRLWTMELTGCPAAGCTPKRVTTANVGEHSPAWSPDGQYLAWVTWTEAGGDVMRIGMKPGAKPERLTRQTAFYEDLNYDPTGKRLVVVRGPRQQRVERENEFEGPGPQVMELVWLPANGGDVTMIAPVDQYGRPHFTHDTTRVFLYDPEEGLVSIRWDGTDRKALLKVTGYKDPRRPDDAEPDSPDEMLISPDGSRAFVSIDNKLYLVAVPLSGGKTPTVSVETPAAPVPTTRLSRVGGDFLGWAPDGNSVYWSLGHSYFKYDIVAATKAVKDSTAKADSLAKTGAKPDTSIKPAPAYAVPRLDVAITVPKDRPTGTVLLHGAKIISMKGNEVIANGDVLINGTRIAAVGAAGSLTVPAGTRTIDVTGKTIIPGWVDIHAHMWPNFGIHRTQVYEYLVNLAYGVTTTRDPQTSTTDVLSYSDLVETGVLIGPRVYSTGPGLFSGDQVSSQTDANEVMLRYSDFYKTNTLKQYMTGQRMIRQWVLKAAMDQMISPTLEGGLDFKKNLTEAIDGYAGSEHAYPIMPLYNDVVKVIAATGITYTPTLIVQYGGPFGENYWFEKWNIHDDVKLRHFTPHAELDRRGLRRPGWFREDQYSFTQVSAEAAKIVAAGGHVGLGGHGELQGLGVHFELWMMASGGMPLHDVLRVGTIFGAEAIGLSKDLGSIEVGKLADLQVLDADPTVDIMNTNTIRYVMKNGRLYDGSTLDQVWPVETKLPMQYWWSEQEK